MTNGRQNLYLTLLMVFLIVVIAVGAAHCQVVRYDFPDPALRGMASNIDPSELMAEEALYLENADVNATMGILRKRKAVKGWGANSVVLWGATGYYNPSTGHKLLLGVTDHPTYSLGQFVVSDTFGVNAGADTLGGTIFPYADAYHDWTPYKGLLIHADGKSVPSIFTADAKLNYRYTTSDTLGYGPHVISMAAVAPGQPRLGLIDTTGSGSATGFYQYAFAHAGSPMGIPSRLVEVKTDLRPYLTNIPYRDTLIIVRRKQYADWFVLDTIDNADGSYSMYVDTTGPLSSSSMFQVRWYDGGGVHYDTFSTLNGVRDLVWYTTAGCIRKYAFNRVWGGVPWDPSCCGGYRVSAWDGATEYVHPNLANDFPGSSWPDDWVSNYDSFTTDVQGFSTRTVYADGAWRYIVDYTRNDSALVDTFLNPSSAPTSIWTYPCSTFGPVVFNCGVELDSYDSLAYRESFVKGVTTYTCSTGFPSYRRDYYTSVTTDVDSFFIDSFPSGQLFLNPDTGERPGRLYEIDYGPPVFCDTIASRLLHHAHAESTYYIAYSYYDPVTGLESPLGPSLACTLIVRDTIGGDTTCFLSKRFGWRDYDTTSSPGMIRIYQTIVETELPGAGDTNVWYGVLEVKNTDTFVTFGNWSDNDVVSGLDTSYITVQQYYTYQMLRTGLGYVKTLPPYNYDCQVPFSDLEYFAGRFYGIGDPGYPNRIYYSQHDAHAVDMSIFSWNPFDFLQVLEVGNDEFIALEKAEGYGSYALYVFAHNSIWLITADHDYQAISTRIGAVSRETIVKHGEAIYFMSPRMRFYVLWGTSLTEISKPIENWIESLFVSYSWFTGYGDYRGRAMTLGDYVMWSNDSTGKILAFNTKEEAGTWSVRSYQQGNYKPRGSFFYDTLRTNEISLSFTTDLELLYGVTDADSSIPFRQEIDGNYDLTGTASDLILLDYQTPHLGDDFRQWQVSQIRIKAEPLASSILHYSIYNENEDSLCGGTYTFSSAEVSSGAPVNIFLAPPYNIGNKLSVRYFTDIDSVCVGEVPCSWQYYWSNLRIHDHSVWLQDMGAYDVQ